MITSREILDVALCFVDRELNGRELEVLEDLCRSAGESWAEQLREGLEPEDCRSAFTIASAWSALAGMLAVMEGTQPTPRSFTAGDLSVRTGGESGRATAKTLRGQAETLMAPYVEGGVFAFLEVRG